MATVAEVAAMIEKNQAAYRKIAEQSRALSRVANPQLAGVGETMRQSLAVYDRQWADLSPQMLAATDISKMIDPSIFSIRNLIDPSICSVGAQVQVLAESLRMPPIDFDALFSVSSVLKQFEGYRFSIDSQLSTIFQDLAEGALTSLRTYPFATPAAAGDWNDDVEVSLAVDEPGGRRWPTLPAVPVSALLSLFAAACFTLAYSGERLLPDDVQVDLRTFAVGLLLIMITIAVSNK